MKLFGRAEVDLMVSLGQYNEVILSIIIATKLYYRINSCCQNNFENMEVFSYTLLLNHFLIICRPHSRKMKTISNPLHISKLELD